MANLADVVGTAFGIALAKANLPVLPTFAALSVGYLIASRCGAARRRRSAGPCLPRPGWGRRVGGRRQSAAYAQMHAGVPVMQGLNGS